MFLFLNKFNCIFRAMVNMKYFFLTILWVCALHPTLSKSWHMCQLFDKVILIKDNGFVRVKQDAVFNVPAYGAG